VDQFYSQSSPDPHPENVQDWRRFARDIFETILLSVILFLGINYVSARIRVESISMQPTLYEGNFVLVNRVAYRLGEAHRGDVIVFRYPLDPDKEPYIKRVIGLPGDEVRIEGGNVYVNGIAQSETYIKAHPSYAGSWDVPENSLFVLGDNRNNSSDSHSWGFVPLDNVIGKAEFVYWPPERWQILNPSSASAASSSTPPATVP
jgi:signal peptidase I